MQLVESSHSFEFIRSLRNLCSSPSSIWEGGIFQESQVSHLAQQAVSWCSSFIVMWNYGRWQALCLSCTWQSHHLCLFPSLSSENDVPPFPLKRATWSPSVSKASAAFWSPLSWDRLLVWCNGQSPGKWASISATNACMTLSHHLTLSGTKFSI